MYQLTRGNGYLWGPASIASLDSLLIKVVSQGSGFSNVYALRRNIAYNLQYLEFLDKTFSSIEMTAVIRRQNIKSFIVVGSGIVESLLTFLLMRRKLYRTTDWEIDGIFPGQPKKVDGVLKRSDCHIYKKLGTPKQDEMNFDSMLKKAESKKVLGGNHDVYADLKRVRRLRNRVHLQVIDHPTDTDWNAFSDDDLKTMGRTIYEIFTGGIFSPTEQQKGYFSYLQKYMT